ncbi:hypothetical protein [Lentibacillus saliphilus]|uniref:hypothetical protein n=1 Tax=Lentibacillus saliphilus TaxID=2737028 RepID=UPI001C30941B|nr:hypothetical protein [Lentibacillus saliphilus]
MNDEANFQDDQAAELRKLIGEVQDVEHKIEESPSPSDQQFLETDDKIDILNLPPRKTVHQNDKTGFKFKLRRPLIRLIVVSVIVLCVLIASWIMMDDHMIDSLIPL